MTIGQAVPIEDIDTRLREVEGKILRLEIERDLLRRLRGKAQAVAIKPVSAGIASAPSRGQLGPKAAILALVLVEPGLQKTEIIQKLRDNIATSAGNVDRVLASTIYNLERGNLIRPNGNGGYHPVE